MDDSNVYKLGVKNIIYSVIAQGISFILSIITGFVLPKVMGIAQYGYWQVYLFYVGYVMIFCFGYNDGLYLRYGNLNYEQLPFKKLRSSMRIFIGIISAMTCILFALSFREHDTNKIFAFCTTSLNLIILGINGTLLTVLQFTNRIKLNSILTIANKVIFVFIIVLLLLIKRMDFRLIISADIFTKLLLLSININKSKELFIGETQSVKQGFKEFWEDTSIGIKLMLANIASTLLIGIGKFIVERFMSIETYSLYSFATTITSFALIFITASSLSLYPLLKRVDEDKLSTFYVNLNQLLCFILFVLLFGYYPIYYLIKFQFPSYVGIFEYFYLLFIIIVSQGKMQFLINTYYKVLREEKAMLIANLSGVVVALIIIVPSFYFTHSIFAIVAGTTITLIWRCYASEIYLKKKMRIKQYSNIIVELLMMFLFIISVIFKRQIIGLTIYTIAVCGYYYKNRTALNSYVKKIAKLTL
ncbi:lipopolysaccharide biosynthesis protein [Clostridium sulfidigenes]|uniref:lipopolysaccharide biosynthesis protein n=1 Tax=Clostridium sulfidigenes TaxID=318464 RepID=UPI003F8CE509